MEEAKDKIICGKLQNIYGAGIFWQDTTNF